ncbi:MAG: Histone acetyltransferase [Planctomycetota bacterium]|nr:Histone acetyltransferase [Planctomycetota bacterium]
MTELILRDALRPEDRSHLERILRASGAFREEEVSVGLELADETLNPRPDTDYLWVLADRGGDLLGFACYGLVPMTEGTFDLYWIAVVPEARGSNVATRLDEAVTEAVRKRGGRWVLAETSSTEPYAAARRFYAKRGYCLVERIPDFYRDGDDRVTFGKRV